MNLSAQRRIASRILGVGQNKVWIDPDAADDVSLSFGADNDVASSYPGADIIKGSCPVIMSKGGKNLEKFTHIRVRSRYTLTQRPGTTLESNHTLVGIKDHRRTIKHVVPIFLA